MAGRREVRAIGPSYQLADRRAASQRTVNMYLQPVEAPGEDRQFILKSCPGLDAAYTGGLIRAAYSTGVVQYLLAGSTVEKLTPSGASWIASTVGSISSTTGPARMAYGRDQLVIVDGANGWVVNLATDTLTQITDPDWRGSYDVDSLDGYFIFADPNSSDQFYISAIDDASNLDALDFSSSDVLPDDLITFRVHKRELFLFNRRSTEVWVNSPSGAGFPFVRFSTVPIEVGIVGRKAVAKGADTLFFVGQTEHGRAVVYMMSGHQPRPISNAALESALTAVDEITNEALVDLSECVVWSYQLDGVEFVGVEAPGMETTWVYDARSQTWHEQGILVSDEWTPMGIKDTGVFGHQVWVIRDAGAYSLTRLHFRVGAYTSNFPALQRERTFPHLISPSYEPITYRSLELLCSSGYPADYPQTSGAPANITLEVSNDGGYTFGPPQWRTLGATGRFMQPVRWNFLGSARDRVFRVRCSDNVDFSLYGAQVDAS